MVECNDKNCYIHGSVRVRGGRFTGKIVSDKGKRTVIVERSGIQFITKYQRRAKIRSKTPAHNPDCVSAKEGDMVSVGETRKLSKTKAWTVLEVLKPEAQ